MSQPIGTIEQLVRFPVKSFGGEQLQSVEVTPYGLYGDRSAYFTFDDEQQKYVTIQTWPPLAAYRATLGEPDSQNGLPAIAVTNPSGKSYSWPEEGLLQEIADGTKRAIKVHQRRPDEETVNFTEPLLITTTASLRALCDLMGREEIDNARFRSNLVLQTDVPFVEETWLGKHVRIGDVVLELTDLCPRCFYINVSPADGSVDPAILKTVFKERQENFGVFARVVTPGTLHLGDTASLVEGDG
ncbi:MOSC domain-containing protein [Tumebacillus sp. ITR2]|uniref:MOSC domain-containing protein n=1 Tax=Tumebacillus amylolyticus TaxID=2801339 RepID=A0ABS1J9R6_9BACL|nr:MOSC domain-containing protein [Tumebacillus amylolyticus]MBL0386999.1 MOSC domain-containing protein [Tumebacillus amylolyticus]